MTKFDYENFAKDCLHGKLSPCSAACPLNLDVRAFAEQLQSGNFTAAYKLLRNKVVFPAIVSRVCSQPCKSSCVREGHDEAISLRMLELASVQFTDSDEPLRFNLPKKNKRIAVIGGGLAGLTCALRLGARCYDVTLYERSGRVGGRLWDMLDPGVFLPEIERQMQYVSCNIELNREITSLEDIEFDAAYIATGKGGEHFGLLDGIDEKSFGTVRPGVFIGGGVLGAAPVEDIAQASVVAHSIEKYVKIGRMDGMPESFMITETKLKKDLSNVSPEAAVKPHQGAAYDRDEAVAEAKRCLRCNCTECKEGCELFSYFSKPPQLMVAEAITTLSSKSGLTRQQATRTMSSCNLCGLCGKVCPQGIDMGSFFYDFRHFKFEDKVYPPAFHDFFIRDMLFSNSAAAVSRLAPGHTAARYMFFPGCQLGASDPRYVTRSYEYLLEIFPDTAIMLGCCGAPADWGADRELNDSVIAGIKEKWDSFRRPAIIFSCPTCQLQLQKFLPEANGISLYEVMAEKGLPGGKTELGRKSMCVFDPCASRNNVSMQRSVRRMASMSGANIEELQFHGEKAQCCGWGGHIAKANRNLEERIVQNRINASENPYITYCTNCHDTFVREGKQCVHILDIVFGLNGGGFAPPSLGIRRKNRLIARNMLLEHVFGETSEEIKEDGFSMKIVISPHMVKKLNSSLTLEEEVAAAIEHCESTGCKLYDPEKNCYIGHFKMGIITYWVEYGKNEDKYILLNSYSHRMEILEENRL